jgi:tyrosyl-tRNA synthetase
MPEFSLSEKTMNIVDLLLALNLVDSKANARRLIEQGGIKVNEEVVLDAKKEYELNSGTVVQRGKRQFAKIK